MGRPRKKDIEEVVEENKAAAVGIVEEVVEVPEDTESSLLTAVGIAEANLNAKSKKLSEFRQARLKSHRQPTIQECMSCQMRDDANSEKKELQKFLKAGQAKLNLMR